MCSSKNKKKLAAIAVNINELVAITVYINKLSIVCLLSSIFLIRSAHKFLLTQLKEGLFKSESCFEINCSPRLRRTLWRELSDKCRLKEEPFEEIGLLFIS